MSSYAWTHPSVDLTNRLLPSPHTLSSLQEIIIEGQRDLERPSTHTHKRVRTYCKLRINRKEREGEDR